MNKVTQKQLDKDAVTGQVTIWIQSGPEYDNTWKYQWISRVTEQGHVLRRFGSGKTLDQAIMDSTKEVIVDET